MPNMHITKKFQKDIAHTRITTFLLLDEQQRYALALPISETTFPGPMHIPSPKDKHITEPLTTDFLNNMLHALGGTLERVKLDVLPDENFSTQLHIQDQHNSQTLQAPLHDALQLAHRASCIIEASTEIIEQQGIQLKNYGPTIQKQLASIEKLAEQDPDSLRPLPQKPYNLDFSAGLRGWDFYRIPEYASCSLDPQVTYDGKTCLSVTFHKPYTSGSPGFLAHKGFSANHYRGKRLRLQADIKVEHMHQPIIELTVTGPFTTISPLTNRPIRSSRLTRSSLIPTSQNNKWTQHELVIDIPSDAHDISFSFGTHEQGKLWIGRIHIETVEQNRTLTATILRPPAQQPQNLDFAQDLAYWGIEGNTSWHYTHGIDEQHKSAYLKALTSAPEGQCSLQQMLNAEDYQGKQVCLRARIKTEDVTNARLFIGIPLDIGENSEEIITGTTDWTLHTLTWQVPHTPWSLLSFGISLSGTGQIWLADVSLEVTE